MKMRVILVSLFLLALIAFAIAGVGCGKKKSRTTLPVLNPAGGTAGGIQAPAQPVEMSLDAALAELEELQPPEGVDPGVFGMLKDELAKALVERGEGKFASTPPGDTSRVTDLDLVDNWDGSYSLVWHYRNHGDYDQDGVVSIADITPIAMHFGETVPPEGEDTLIAVVDGSGNGTVDIADVTPIAQGFLNEVAGYRIEGTASLLDQWNQVDSIDFSQAQGLGRKYFDYRMYSIGFQTYHVVPFDSGYIDGVASVDTLSSHSIEVSGSVEWDTGGPVAGAWVIARTSDGSSMGEVEADGNGEFMIELAPVAFNIKVTIEASITEPTTGLEVTNFHTTEEVETGGSVDSLLVVLPDPVGTEMIVTGDHAESPAGDIIVEGLPGEVAQVFGRSYDPDADPEAFPGEFADENQASLNSSVFLWISGKDTEGAQVDQLSAPATLKLEVPHSQWADLEDIFAGNERIDIPIYDFNYETQTWAAANDGWLVDETGFPFPEEMQEEITSGAYSGRVYAQFEASHFSFHNVDYPYIGPWTLSRLPSEQRRTKLIYRAFNLAKKIAASQRGHDAYSKVNDVGADLDEELKDGAGPEALYTTLTDANGEYRGEGRASATHVDKTQVHLHSGMWDWYTGSTSELQNKRTIILMASTLLHESAHWKDDVKKTGPDTHGEEGKQLEQDLFGGDISMDYDTGELYIRDLTTGDPATAVTEAQLDAWLNAETWPKAGSSLRRPSQDRSLALAISSEKSLFYLGEQVPVTIEFENTGSENCYIYSMVILNGYPVTFVVEDSSGQPVAFLGAEYDVNMLPDDFVELGPGETLQLQADLLSDPVSGELHFDLYEQGDYTVKAYYDEYPQAESNEIGITIGPGGRIAGTITDEDTMLPVSGATVKVYSGNRVVSTVSSLPNGGYLSDEVPVGTVSVSAWKLGYYVTRATGITSTGGVTTTGVDLALSETDGREWFMFGREETHKRRSPVAGPQTPTVRWTFETGGGIEESSPALGPDGTIFIGSMDGYLYAIYPSGTLRWQTELGGSVQSSPVIRGDGMIYVGCQDTLLYALDLNGDIQWIYDTDGAVNASPAVGTDGSVYFGSRGQKFFALDDDGSLQWEYVSDGPGSARQFASSPAIAIDGTVYAGCDDYTLYAFTPAGALDWRYDTGERIYASPTIGDDGTIYFGTWGQYTTGYVYALNPDGSLNWQYPVGSYNVDASPALGYDGTIYVGSSEGVFYAINPDGSLQWTFAADGSIWSSAAVGADGTIYFGDEGGYVYALNPDGSLLWSYQTGGRIHRSGPIIAGDGALYVGSADRMLYKFRD